jgi:hypothetical protein
MAATLTGFVQPIEVILGAANVATKVNVPSFTTALHIQFRAVNGLYAYQGTDGGALGVYFQLSADEIVQLQHRSDQPIYLASSTPGAVAVIMAWDRSE